MLVAALATPAAQTPVAAAQVETQQPAQPHQHQQEHQVVVQHQVSICVNTCSACQLDGLMIEMGAYLACRQHVVALGACLAISYMHVIASTVCSRCSH